MLVLVACPTMHVWYVMPLLYQLQLPKGLLTFIQSSASSVLCGGSGSESRPFLAETRSQQDRGLTHWRIIPQQKHAGVIGAKPRHGGSHRPLQRNRQSTPSSTQHMLACGTAVVMNYLAAFLFSRLRCLFLLLLLLQLLCLLLRRPFRCTALLLRHGRCVWPLSQTNMLSGKS